MSRYANGVRWEYAVRDWFGRRGYEVIRSAGSHGATDLIAFREDDVILVQCKVEKKRKRYDDDAEQLRKVKTPTGWRKLLLVKTIGHQVLWIDVMTMHSLSLSLRSFHD